MKNQQQGRRALATPPRMPTMPPKPKERPITFSSKEATSIRAILEGTKTQTRRVVRSEHAQDADMWREDVCGRWQSGIAGDHGRYGHGEWVRCPFGVPGDRLWVREAFAEVHPLQVAEGRHSLPGRAGIPGPPRVDYRIIFRADGEYPRLHFQRGEHAHPWRAVCEPGCSRAHLHPEEAWHGWAPSIHMPRWASRITLEVTGVRVERLQEIGLAAAAAEGAHRLPLQEEALGGCWWTMDAAAGPDYHARTAVGAFRKVWDTINGKRAPWVSNPWCWVLSFRRVEP